MFVVRLLLAIAATATVVASSGLEKWLYLARIGGNYSKDYADLFVLPVSIGNPAVAFNLTLDTEYFESVVIGAGSTSEICSNPTHKGFNISRSTTFRQGDSKRYSFFIEAYMAGHQCRFTDESTVTVGQDDFLGTKGVPFGVITKFKGAWSPDWPSDGILGLRGPDADTAEQPATALTLATVNGGKLVAFYLNHDNRVVGDRVGKIAFGSVPKACGNVAYAAPYFPSRKSGWNFRVTGAFLGKQQNDNLGGKGVLDSSRSILVDVPTDIFTAFMAEINATLDKATKLYYVDCTSAIKLPNLRVKLNDVDLFFPYHAYVDLSNKQSGKCEVLLRSSFSDDFWTFGNRLWQHYCIVLNYDKGQVGFAANGQ